MEQARSASPAANPGQDPQSRTGRSVQTGAEVCTNPDPHAAEDAWRSTSAGLRTRIAASPTKSRPAQEHNGPYQKLLASAHLHRKKLLVRLSYDQSPTGIGLRSNGRRCALYVIDRFV